MYTLNVILKDGSGGEFRCKDFIINDGLIFCYKSKGKVVGVIKEWVSFWVVEEEE